jgi:hypothetical protein
VDVIAEFGGTSVRPYAQLAFAQFAGLEWTNPSNAADTWGLSDSALITIAGGARFGGKFYGKAALGVLVWPEVSRVDYTSGYAEPVFESGALVTFAVGGGAEFKLGKLVAVADAEFAFVPAPEPTQRASVFWPNFTAEGTNVLRIAGAIGFTF